LKKSSSKIMVKQVKGKHSKINLDEYSEMKRKVRNLTKVNGDLQKGIKTLDANKRNLERALEREKNASVEKISQLVDEKGKLKKRCVRLQKKMKISDPSPAVETSISHY